MFKPKLKSVVLVRIRNFNKDISSLEIGEKTYDYNASLCRKLYTFRIGVPINPCGVRLLRRCS